MVLESYACTNCKKKMLLTELDGGLKSYNILCLSCIWQNEIKKEVEQRG